MESNTKRQGSYRELKSRINELYQHNDYNAALQLTEQGLEVYPCAPALLLMKGVLLQLVDDDSPLEEARHYLESAEMYDCGQNSPTIELGNFSYALDQDSNAALRYFQRAEALALSILEEALVGQVRALLDIGKFDEARQVLDEAKTSIPTSGATWHLLELEFDVSGD